MKGLGLVVVVALGIVVGLWWTRDAPVARDTPIAPVTRGLDQTAGRSQPGRARGESSPQSSPAARPMLAKQKRPTLEPTETDPVRRELQEALWREMRGFASEAQLTESQWDQFVRDVAELGEMDSIAWGNAVKTDDFEGAIEIAQSLGHDLEARCAAYMTKDQLSVMRFRLNPYGLVTRVRQLFFVPTLSRVQAEYRR